MSKWQDVFNGQQVPPKVVESLRLLEAAKLEGVDQLVLINYARLLKALKVISVRLDNLDPELYHPNTWQSIGGWATNLQTYCVNFSQNPQQGGTHLNSANAMADEMLVVLRPVESLSGEKYIGAVSEALTSFQNKALAELKSISEISEKQKTSLGSLSTAIAAEKTRLDSFGAVVEQQKVRLDQSIATYQKQFSDAETSRSATFAADSKQRLDEFQKLLKTVESDHKTAKSGQGADFLKHMETVRKEGEAHLKHLNLRQEEVEKIFNAIGTASFAGNFCNSANDERDAANSLRKLSLGLMVVMVLIAAGTFIYSLFNVVEAHIFAFRLATSVVVLIPAIYAAQESAKHRAREKSMRKMHLELASIDAYLVLLPEAQRHEIKAKLTEKFFGREELSEKDEPVTKHALFDLLSSAFKNITKAK